MKEKIHSYEDDQLRVDWDKHRCIHFAACVGGMPQVFDTSAKPWIQPSQGEGEAVRQTVLRCPTGALHYTPKTDSIAAEVASADASITLAANGPVYMKGDISVQDTDGNELLRDTRVALCRCGLSSNKPLCDGSHHEKFSDSGRIDHPNRIKAIEASGPLTVVARPNGSVLVRGPFRMYDAGGNCFEGSQAALCRCGASQHKPFCDGSHKAAGFLSE